MVQRAIVLVVACLLTVSLGYSQYVDSAVCGGCHQDIARSFRSTGMGRSAYRPSSENAPEDYRTRNSLYHRPSDRYYKMLERDGKFYQRRHQIGFDGNETNVVEKQIDFVIGSGNHARTYLHREPNGTLMELPVSWYTEQGGYWAMSPGYDRADQRDFRRAVSDDCLFCHSAYSAGQPAAIDCQRCHGPGRAHVTAAGSGRATVDAVRRAIVNPSRLSRDRQLEVCMQCHLETTSSPLPNAIRRYDRGPFSYRPGQPLGDYAIYFDRADNHADNTDRFEIAHAGYRLRKSACFQGSQMTCTTCHDPHREERGEQAAQHYIAVCKSCHASAHRAEAPASGNCVDCHMPKRRAEDAVHVVMTDHYIQRRKPARDLLAPLEEQPDTYQGEVTPYYPPHLPPTPENQLYLAVAQVKDGANLESGIPRLQQIIDKYRPIQPQFYFELGDAYLKTGKNADAIRWYEQALRREPGSPGATKQLVAALLATGQVGRAIKLLQKSAPDAIVLTNLANVYLSQGARDQAERALQQALRIDADLAEAQNLLGLLRLGSNDRSGAEAYFRQAIRNQPELAAAHNNLANLLTGAEDYRQAAYHFEKAIRSDPSYAEAHHGYGLLLVLMRSYSQAASELREAVKLDPNSAEAHTDLGDLLAAQGHKEDAQEQYRLAEQAKQRTAQKEKKQ